MKKLNPIDVITKVKTNFVPFGCDVENLETDPLLFANDLYKLCNVIGDKDTTYVQFSEKRDIEDVIYYLAKKLHTNMYKIGVGSRTNYALKNFGTPRSTGWVNMGAFYGSSNAYSLIRFKERNTVRTGMFVFRFFEPNVDVIRIPLIPIALLGLQNFRNAEYLFKFVGILTQKFGMNAVTPEDDRLIDVPEMYLNPFVIQKAFETTRRAISAGKAMFKAKRQTYFINHPPDFQCNVTRRVYEALRGLYDIEMKRKITDYTHPFIRSRYSEYGYIENRFRFCWGSLNSVDTNNRIERDNYEPFSTNCFIHPDDKSEKRMFQRFIDHPYEFRYRLSRIETVMYSKSMHNKLFKNLSYEKKYF